MQVSTSITSLALNRVADETTRLEAAGFKEVTTHETARDPFLPHAIAATATRKLALRTSIATDSSFGALAAAKVAWDLQQVSGGRFTLGLCGQIHTKNKDLLDSIDRLRVAFYRWGTDGKRKRFLGIGDTEPLFMSPNLTPASELTSYGQRPAIQITNCIGHMAGVAAGIDVCDGAQLHPFCTAMYLREFILPMIESNLAKRGLRRSDFTVSGGGFIATGATDEAVQRAFDQVRKRIAFYGSIHNHWGVLQRHGLGDLGEKLREMRVRGERDAMTDEINDDVVHLFCASGRHDEIAVAIAERFGGLTDMIELDADVPAELVTDIQQAVGPSNTQQVGERRRPNPTTR